MKFSLASKRKNIFWRFMVSYLILLAVILAIGVITYNLTLKLVEKDAIESSLSVLDQSKQILDTRLMEVESMGMQLSMDYRVQAFLDAPKPLIDTDYERLRDMQSKLPSYRLTNKFIFDTYIYFKNSDTILSANYSSSRTDIIYNLILKYENMNLEQWEKKVNSKYYKSGYWPAQKVSSENINQSQITYVQSIPSGSYNNPKGAIIVLIKESEVHKILSGLQIKDGGWYYISDKDGNVITSEKSNFANDGDKKNIYQSKMETDTLEGYEEVHQDGQRMFLIYSRSAYNGWTYVAAIPSKTIFAKVNYIKRVYSFTALISFLVGLIIATYLAYRNSRPVKELIRKIQGRFEGPNNQGVNEYDFLDGTIFRLIESNTSMKVDMEKQVPILRAVFFERLFRGGFNRSQEIQSIEASLGLEFEWDRFVVFLARIEGYNNEVSAEIAEQMDVARIVVVNVFKKHMGENGYCHNPDMDKIALLYGLSLENEPNWANLIEKMLRNIITECFNEFNIRLTFGIGTIYKNILDVNKSYEEAVSTLEYKGENKTDIILYSNIPKGVSAYYYPLELELRLMNLIKMGEDKEVITILDLIYKKNFSSQHLSTKMQTELLYEIKGTITKLKQQIVIEDIKEVSNLEEKLQRLAKSSSTKEIYDTISEIYKLLCDRVNSAKKSHNVKLKNNIIEFIHNEFINEDLCLYKVASKFDLAETYLSQFFKEQIGETFSNYLEKMRMNQAVQLLNEGKLSINEIVKQIGYNNSNTFYKAFKRIYGVSPREHQKCTQSVK